MRSLELFIEALKAPDSYRVKLVENARHATYRATDISYPTTTALSRWLYANYYKELQTLSRLCQDHPDHDEQQEHLPGLLHAYSYGKYYRDSSIRIEPTCGIAGFVKICHAFGLRLEIETLSPTHVKVTAHYTPTGTEKINDVS